MEMGRHWIWRQTWGVENQVQRALCYIELAGGETTANGHRGNSTGHGRADHMLIGGLVAERLILKALVHIERFLAVKHFGRKILKDQLPSSNHFSVLV